MDGDAASFDALRQVWPVLDERQRRLMAAALARTFGRGGPSLVARELGLSRTTVHAGLAELDAADFTASDATAATRTAGGGRPKALTSTPTCCPP